MERISDQGATLKRALALTCVILAVEFAGGVVSHSLALLSDAGHDQIDWNRPAPQNIAILGQFHDELWLKRARRLWQWQLPYTRYSNFTATATVNRYIHHPVVIPCARSGPEP